MEFETIMQLVTILVTLVLGVISKKSTFINNNLIPMQNIIIGLVMALIHWFITKDISLAIGFSGLGAGGTYDFFKNLLEIKKPQKVVGDEPSVYEEIEVSEDVESND
jgi:Na+/glutamate symporter